MSRPALTFSSRVLLAVQARKKSRQEERNRVRRENEQPLVQLQGGGAVHPTRLKKIPDSKRLSTLPAVKEPLSKLRQRLGPESGSTVCLFALQPDPAHPEVFLTCMFLPPAVQIHHTCLRPMDLSLQMSTISFCAAIQKGNCQERWSLPWQEKFHGDPWQSLAFSMCVEEREREGGSDDRQQRRVGGRAHGCTQLNASLT